MKKKLRILPDGIKVCEMSQVLQGRNLIVEPKTKDEEEIELFLRYNILCCVINKLKVHTQTHT